MKNISDDETTQLSTDNGDDDVMIERRDPPANEEPNLDEDLALSDDSDDSEADPHYDPRIESCSSSDDDNYFPASKTQSTTPAMTETHKKGRSRFQRAESKKLRNSGKSYVTEKGKIVPERKMRPLKPCRMKCSQRIKEEDREVCFTNYWKLGSRNKRASYIGSLITINKKKTQKMTINSKKNRSCSCSYEVIINKEKVPVCRSCFETIFGETKGFVQLIIQKKNVSPCGILPSDSRGLAPPKTKKTPEQMQDVKSHIQSFPFYESHYCRNRTNKKFLASNLTISRMYDLYKEGRENPVSLTLYTECFHDLGLSFKKPQQDTCHKCDLLEAKLKVATDITKTELLAERDAHHAMANDAYEQKRKDKMIAKEDPTKAVFAFDLQQCLPTPYLKTSVSFYKRQLWSFNLTVHNLASDEATCYMWDETIAARGANEIGSCLYHFLQNLGDEVEEVTFYSDTCGGQNKNNIVAFMFLYILTQKPTLKTINHKFLVSGHSHMECDTDHSVIERAKKRTNMKINHLNDWIQLVRTAKQKNPFHVIALNREQFYNFSMLGKNKGPYIMKKKDVNGDRFLWKPVQWLQYGMGEGQIFFKHSLNESDAFKKINFSRRGRPSVISLQIMSNDQLAISAEKKKDLLTLLPLIDEPFQSFYMNLKTKGDPSTDPDLEEWDPDEENDDNDRENL